MKVWKSVLDVAEHAGPRKKPALETDYLHIKTPMGEFTIHELESGGLEIHGSGPSNHKKRESGLAVYPSGGCNVVQVEFAPRSRARQRVT